MRRVIVSEFVSLDGVMEDPSWTFQFMDEARDRFKFDELAASGALLLGRVTYEGFAAAWPGMEGETGEYGAWMNGYPKHVASTTLEEPLEWNNSILIKGDVPEGVAALKEQTGKDIPVFGSADLVNTLTQHDLIDEYRLMVFPLVVGRGKRPFGEGLDTKAMRLVGTTIFDSGTIVLTYGPAEREPEYMGSAAKRPVLFVHGGGEGAHKADQELAASLQDALGAGYEVRSPKMPNEDSPEYGAWRDRIAEELADTDGEATLAGHSLGASILLKYLAEENPERPLAGVFLVATPYWGAEDWEVDEYALPEDFASKLPEGVPMFFYHGREDEVVLFGHLALYKEKLPWATFRGFDGLGHQFDDDLSRVARDIEETSRPTAGCSRESDLPTELSKPARRALVGAGYRRLEQLDGLDESEVGGLHGVGSNALGQLRRALAARGLSFAGGKGRLAEEEA